MLENIKEACGVFGVQNFHRKPVFPYLYWGLRAQNHRGHQSHGFLTFNGGFHLRDGLDLIPKIKGDDLSRWITLLPGDVGIGNVRYTTSGRTDRASLLKSTQPLLDTLAERRIALSFNGNIVNSRQLEKTMGKRFPEFSCSFDAELLSMFLLADPSANLASAVRTCMKEVEGAFSVAGITDRGEMFAFKDPYGIRPLCCGYSEDRKMYAISSETVGLDINDLEFDFEVNPGELVVASENGFTRECLVNCEKQALCAFEFAYFARPDSRLGNKFVYEVREAFGRNLAREYPKITKDVDLILSMPETGNDAAYGLHEESGKRWERASRRHRYVTERAFILLPEERYTTVNRKINIIDHKVVGKTVAVVDDSIVRGDTTKVVVKKLYQMGAKKVYLYITFPRIIGPCFYGVDMATYGELIGSRYNSDEIAAILDATAVNYQSVDGLVKATGLPRNALCLGCITGKYPTPMAQELADDMKKRFENGHKENGRIYEVALH